MVNLPKKEHHPLLDDNFGSAKKRLASLERRLEKDENLKMNYKNVIEEKIDRGVIERVETKGEVGGTYYMPHSAVIRNDRQTTKTRVFLCIV